MLPLQKCQAYSDERLKDDIEPIEGALERVGKLQGVEPPANLLVSAR